jgi:hypothetical protein
MPPQAPLSQNQLKSVAAGLAQILDNRHIEYAIMGGAAICLLGTDPTRRTEDLDLVVQVDQRNITADRLTTLLLQSYPSRFAQISQYGHIIPGYILNLPGGGTRVVQLEVFDHQSWPQRPQYNLQNARRKLLTVGGRTVKTFSPEWLLREKILSQYQRQGTPKELIDIRDLTGLLPIATAGRPELNFNADQLLKTALANLLQKRPALTQSLQHKINCSAVFDAWYAWLTSS